MNNKRKNLGIKIVIAFIGLLFAGVGIAFNAAALLGNDPISVLYDGVRKTIHFTPEQFGIVSAIVNIVLMIVVFFTDRKYIHIGTFIYVISLGTSISMGTKLFEILNLSTNLFTRGASAVLGSVMLFVGIAIFIVVDIGLDPWTGTVFILSEKVKHPYKKVKVAFDIVTLIIGILLGGKIGVVTVLTALLAGPSIQFFSDYIRNHCSGFLKRINE
ncbi:YczE/YyaS/YitT family protein [Anaeromicropila herbilytica]|uniref:Membrane protein n=1 Tax=Anaeromicropila herbilytica TaxID=2785025 RepID=A0A7R7EPQ1_9FIRM|nr:hypothetical protein [Anaeromicropila herbilytica]BCN32805.1 membrane protein [Anaeromicropila herbilytica]